MTTELEQKFYDAFGIEKRHIILEDDYGQYQTRDKMYPEITAEKLLQLLCIVINEYNRNGHTFYLDSTNVKELKEEILDALMGCIDTTCDLFETEIKQIQQLFKVGKGIVGNDN